MNPKPDYPTQQRLESIIYQVNAANGVKSWIKSPSPSHDLGQGFLWNAEFQEFLKDAGYKTEITPPQVVVTNGKVMKESEMITVMSSEFVKEKVKNKMKQEFS